MNTTEIEMADLREQLAKEKLRTHAVGPNCETAYFAEGHWYVQLGYMGPRLKISFGADGNAVWKAEAQTATGRGGVYESNPSQDPGR